MPSSGNWVPSALAFPCNEGRPYRVALLLRHRLDWAGVFEGVQLRQADGGENVELTLAIAGGTHSLGKRRVTNSTRRELCFR